MLSPLRILLCFAAIVCLATPLVSSAAPNPGKNILAYYENDDGPSSAALHARQMYFNQVAADTYSVDSLGAVSGTYFASDMALARSAGMQTFATVSNFADGDFNAAIVHSIVHSVAYIQKFIEQVTKKLAAGHYTGLNVDFEAVPSTDRKAYTTFIKTVSAQMHAAGYVVVVSVPAKSSDDPSDSWTGAFDFRALGANIDVMQLMTYDENGSWGDPGPTAGLDWVEQAIKYAVSVVTPAKISFGIPAYGYDWDLTDLSNNTQLAWTAIAPLVASTKANVVWDGPSSSPHFKYTADGHKHVVWCENTRSIELKSKLATTYNLGGVSVYALGMENVSFWQAVHAGGL